jgi:cathepsin E
MSPTLDGYTRYLEVTGAVFDEATGLPRITEAQYENLQSLFFCVGYEEYELTANAQIWSRDVNTNIGGEEGAIYLAVYDMGPRELTGNVSFVLGMPFLERYYFALDTTNQLVGIAPTQNTYADTN